MKQQTDIMIDVGDAPRELVADIRTSALAALCLRGFEPTIAAILDGRRAASMRAWAEGGAR